MDTNAPLPPNDLQQLSPAQTIEYPPQKQEETPQISLQDQMFASAPNHPGIGIPSVATGDQFGYHIVSWAGMCPYIPAGKISVLAGFPGVGKTAIALSIAADVTKKDRRNVLYISYEDAIHDTLMPWFRNACGDARRLIFCDGYFEQPGADGNPQKVYSRIDHNSIEELNYIADVAKPKLIVFDPLDPLYRGASFARETKAREAVRALVRLANTYNCAVLLVTHLDRRNNRTAIEQIRDNTILANAARSILLAGELTAEPGAYAMVHVKCNVTERGPSLKYIFDDGAFEWCDPIRANFDDIMPRTGRDNTTPGLMTAKRYLVERLKYGPVSVEDLEYKAPCSKRTLFRAKEALGVSSMKSRVVDGHWYWCLKSLNPKMDLRDYYEA